MIDHLDNLLRQLFFSEIDEITEAGIQVRFQPPDETWRKDVANLTVKGEPANALNVYLVDLRENRKLRSNERARSFNGTAVHEEQAPRRVDCHYLISAWSPAAEVVAVERTVDEHLLLYKAIAALNRHESLVPREVYEPDPLPPKFPPGIADSELPVSLLPVEGFPNYAEFWGTMGSNHRWKPAVWLIVTIPVLYGVEFAGAMVTTRIAEFRTSGVPESAQTLIQIGGRVLNTAPIPPGPPVPISHAWVRLMTRTDHPLQITQTDEAGRFTFSGPEPGGPTKGKFRLHYQATGLGKKSLDIEVPSPTGKYDLLF